MGFTRKMGKNVKSGKKPIKWLDYPPPDAVNPFPNTTNLQQTTLKTSRQKHRKSL